MKPPRRRLPGFASEVCSQPGDLRVCPVSFSTEAQEHLVSLWLSPRVEAWCYKVKAYGEWVSCSMMCGWEPGPSHCLMSSQHSMNGERYGPGTHPAALPPQLQRVLVHCLVGPRGCQVPVPLDSEVKAGSHLWRALTWLLFKAAYVSRAPGPSLLPFTWKASSKFAIGMSAATFIKKGQF